MRYLRLTSGGRHEPFHFSGTDEPADVIIDADRIVLMVGTTGDHEQPCVRLYLGPDEREDFWYAVEGTVDDVWRVVVGLQKGTVDDVWRAVVGLQKRKRDTL